MNDFNNDDFTIEMWQATTVAERLAATAAVAAAWKKDEVQPAVRHFSLPPSILSFKPDLPPPIKLNRAVYNHITYVMGNKSIFLNGSLVVGAIDEFKVIHDRGNVHLTYPDGYVTVVPDNVHRSIEYWVPSVKSKEEQIADIREKVYQTYKQDGQTDNGSKKLKLIVKPNNDVFKSSLEFQKNIDILLSFNHSGPTSLGNVKQLPVDTADICKKFNGLFNDLYDKRKAVKLSILKARPVEFGNDGLQPGKYYFAETITPPLVWQGKSCMTARMILEAGGKITMHDNEAPMMDWLNEVPVEWKSNLVTPVRNSSITSVPLPKAYISANSGSGMVPIPEPMIPMSHETMTQTISSLKQYFNHKKENSMSNITIDTLVQLANGGSIHNDEFVAENMSVELAQALAELQVEEKKETAKKAAKEIYSVLTGANDAIQRMVDRIRTVRREETELANSIKKVNAALAYAKESNNYLPLLDLMGQVSMAVKREKPELFVIPEPKVAAALVEKKPAARKTTAK